MQIEQSDDFMLDAVFDVTTESLGFDGLEGGVAGKVIGAGVVIGVG